MDRAPTEHKKSLDQLLEQGLAERGREEDQVEVTYELGDSNPSEQRQFRLKPESSDGSLLSSRVFDKEDAEDENEETVGSVQMEKKVVKNTLILSIAGVFCFSAFLALQSFQSTLFPGTGPISLSIIYSLATLSSLYAPVVIEKVGVKCTIVVTTITELFYISTFYYHQLYTLIPSAILLGLSLGPMYCAQMTYLLRNISRISFVTQAMRDKIQQRFLRQFSVITRSSYLWGHLIAALIMSFAGESTFIPVITNSTEEVSSVVKISKMCTGISSQIEEFSLDSDKVELFSSANTVSPKVTEIFLYVSPFCSAIGIVLITVFLEKLEVLLQQDPLERPLISVTLRQIRLVLIDRHVRLVWPMVFFIGIEQAFIFSDFTRSFISCSLGVQSVAFTMMCLGGSNILGSIAVYLFSEHIQRLTIMAASLVCQVGLLMVLWLWTPAKDDAAVLYVVAGGWGLCNAIWETLAMTYVAAAYTDDWQVTFCAYFQMQFLGMALTFSLSNYIYLETKICILAAVLVIAIIPYTILEFRLHHRNHVQNRTAML